MKKLITILFLLAWVQGYSQTSVHYINNVTPSFHVRYDTDRWDTMRVNYVQILKFDTTYNKNMWGKITGIKAITISTPVIYVNWFRYKVPSENNAAMICYDDKGNRINVIQFQYAESSWMSF